MSKHIMSPEPEIQVSKAEFRKLKSLLIKVIQLSQKHGYCYASNDYLGQELGGASERQITRRIRLAYELGWLFVQTGVYEHGSKTGRGLSVSQAGQFVLHQDYSDLSSEIRGGSTKVPTGFAKYGVTLAKMANNQDINLNLVKEPEEIQTDGHDDTKERSGGPERGEDRESIPALYAGDMQPQKGPDYGETQDDVWWDTGTSKARSFEDSGEPGGPGEPGGSAGTIQEEPGANGELRETTTIETQEESRRLMHEWLQARRAGLAA